MSEQWFEHISEQLGGLGSRLDRIEHRLDGVDQRLEVVDERLDELRQHMHVLHEDAIGRIAGLREFDGPSTAEFKEALADLDERLGRRFDPLDVIARNHEQRIVTLEKGR